MLQPHHHQAFLLAVGCPEAYGHVGQSQTHELRCLVFRRGDKRLALASGEEWQRRNRQEHPSCRSPLRYRSVSGDASAGTWRPLVGQSCCNSFLFYIIKHPSISGDALSYETGSHRQVDPSLDFAIDLVAWLASVDNDHSLAFW